MYCFYSSFFPYISIYIHYFFPPSSTLLYDPFMFLLCEVLDVCNIFLLLSTLSCIYCIYKLLSLLRHTTHLTYKGILYNTQHVLYVQCCPYNALRYLSSQEQCGHKIISVVNYCPLTEQEDDLRNET